MQYVFSVKRTLRGLHYCIAYTASGNKPVAVSKKMYASGEAAIHEVMVQLGIEKEDPKRLAGGVHRFQSRSLG